MFICIVRFDKPHEIHGIEVLGIRLTQPGHDTPAYIRSRMLYSVGYYPVDRNETNETPDFFFRAETSPAMTDIARAAEAEMTMHELTQLLSDVDADAPVTGYGDLYE